MTNMIPPIAPDKSLIAAAIPPRARFLADEIKPKPGADYRDLLAQA
jgi:hypothetical protein